MRSRPQGCRFYVHKRSIIDLTYCKIRYVSKFTARSRSSPCDSTAFLYSEQSRQSGLRIGTASTVARVLGLCKCVVRSAYVTLCLLVYRHWHSEEMVIFWVIPFAGAVKCCRRCWKSIRRSIWFEKKFRVMNICVWMSHRQCANVDRGRVTPKPPPPPIYFPQHIENN